MSHGLNQLTNHLIDAVTRSSVMTGIGFAAVNYVTTDATVPRWRKVRNMFSNYREQRHIMAPFTSY